jgi:phosphate transport system substrate-binding protein
MVLLAQWWVENYLESHPHLIIQVNGGGSGGGIAALLNGTTDICQSSRVSAPGCETKSERDVGTVQGAVAVAN